MRLLGILLLAATTASAQRLPSLSMPKHAWDFGLWTQGGTGLSGNTFETRLWNAGLRIGKILTSTHGSGWARGNLEYAVDLVPAYVVFQNNTVYCGGFNPLVLKWNFTAGNRFAPYLEIVGGTLFSTSEVPPGASTVNFRSGGSLGTHIFSREKRAWTLAFRYEHISNAGLASRNSGINTAQFLLGYNWWR